jgi:hypothetical protein
MYRDTDTFSHERHEAAHGDEASCATCHRDPARAKSRDASRPCDDCHRPSVRADDRVEVTRRLPPGYAPGYKLAMHGLCMACHEAEDAAAGERRHELSLCATCHRSSNEPAFQRPPRAGWSLSAAMLAR